MDNDKKGLHQNQRIVVEYFRNTKKEINVKCEGINIKLKGSKVAHDIALVLQDYFKELNN